jgi:hypothetical protein
MSRRTPAWRGHMAEPAMASFDVAVAERRVASLMDAARRAFRAVMAEPLGRRIPPQSSAPSGSQHTQRDHERRQTAATAAVPAAAAAAAAPQGSAVPPLRAAQPREDRFADEDAALESGGQRAYPAIDRVLSARRRVLSLSGVGVGGDVPPAMDPETGATVEMETAPVMVDDDSRPAAAQASSPPPQPPPAAPPGPASPRTLEPPSRRHASPPLPLVKALANPHDVAVECFGRALERIAVRRAFLRCVCAGAGRAVVD